MDIYVKDFFMKYRFFFLCFSLSLFLSGCNFSYEPNNQYTAPTVSYNNTVIVISIPKKTNTTKYISIYRIDITESLSSHENEEENIQNIGIIYPKFADTSSSSYIFYDSHIIKNHSYKYRIRYTDIDENAYTKWSQDVIAKDGYDSYIQMTYNTNNAYLSYDKTSYSLKISGSIIPPSIENFDEDFKPMLIIKTDEKTQVFPIQSIEQDTLIHLRSILPPSFLDTPITITGIVPQKYIYVNSYSANNTRTAASDNNENSTENTNNPENSDSNNNEQNNQNKNNEENENTSDIKEIHWLPKSSIKISGSSNNTITIPSFAQSDGFDYSRKSK